MLENNNNTDLWQHRAGSVIHDIGSAWHAAAPAVGMAVSWYERIMRRWDAEGIAVLYGESNRREIIEAFKHCNLCPVTSAGANA